MCCCTPPGTSQEYGQAMPILTGPPVSRRHRRGCCRRRCGVAVAVAGAALGEALGVEVGDEELLQHVPVFRVLADPLLEDRRHRLGHRGDLLLAVAVGRARGSRRRCARPSSVVALEPARHRHQRRAGLHGQRRRAGREQRLLAEEVDLHAGVGQVPVGHDARPACQRAAAAPSRRTGAGRRSSAAPPCRGPRGTSRKRSKTDSGLSRSATVVNEPAPTRITQRPACSKSPMCGSA